MPPEEKRSAIGPEIEMNLDKEHVMSTGRYSLA
jgi:hypothetical protein